MERNTPGQKSSGGEDKRIFKISPTVAVQTDEESHRFY
jgi:hypothetical protein